MFNSKKLKKLNQQQELLDSKINSLAYGQKSLSEDFEIHFKRLRQSIFDVVGDISDKIEIEMSQTNEQSELLTKNLSYFDGKNPLKIILQESEILKRQNGIVSEQVIMFSTSLQVDLQIVKDQIKDLQNQIEKLNEIPKTEEISKFSEVPNTGENQFDFCETPSPIQDKMKLEISDIFEDENSNDIKKPSIRSFINRRAINDRTEFCVNVKLPEGVINFLHNRSSDKSISATCRNVFERQKKLIFAPLSYEITKNFTNSKLKSVSIGVSKNTYLAMRKIAENLDTTMNYVCSNFVATLNLSERNEVLMQYNTLSSKETQLKGFFEKRGKGRPKNK